MPDPVMHDDDISYYPPRIGRHQIMAPKVNKWLDLLDRAGWTAIQSAAGALIAYLAFDDIGWEEGLLFVGAATAVAVCKVVVGQNTGQDDTGALIGQSVIEPPPTDKK
jgi:hypothetical protein